MKVFLDDIREAPAGWVRTRTADETVELLKSGKVRELSLDHDLGIDPRAGNGYDVLLWIERQVVTNDFTPPVIVVHSANPAAAEKMKSAIQAIGRLHKRRGE